MENSQIQTQLDIAAVIDASERIAIVPSPKRGDDGLCAAIGLHNMLLNRGKNVVLLYNGSIPTECASHIEGSQVRDLVVTKDLLVSIDYKDIDDAQVYFNTEDHTLHLRISPVSKAYNPADKIKYELSSSSYDLIIFVGVTELNDLGLATEDVEDLIKNISIINIDNNDENTSYGTINLIGSSETGLSLIVLKKALEWGIDLTESAAKCLLFGFTK